MNRTSFHIRLPKQERWNSVFNHFHCYAQMSDRYRDLTKSYDDVTCSTAGHSEADDFVKRSVTTLN